MDGQARADHWVQAQQAAQIYKVQVGCQKVSCTRPTHAGRRAAYHNMGRRVGLPACTGDLRSMLGGWSRQKGKFGRGMRRNLCSAAIMRTSDTVWSTAGLLGVEAIRINIRCAYRRPPLGGCRRRTCRRCMVGVDPDVKAIQNIRRTSAAAGMVRAGLGEARCDADTIRVTRTGAAGPTG